MAGAAEQQARATEAGASAWDLDHRARKAASAAPEAVAIVGMAEEAGTAEEEQAGTAEAAGTGAGQHLKGGEGGAEEEAAEQEEDGGAVEAEGGERGKEQGRGQADTGAGRQAGAEEGTTTTTTMVVRPAAAAEVSVGKEQAGTCLCLSRRAVTGTVTLVWADGRGLRRRGRVRWQRWRRVRRVELEWCVTVGRWRTSSRVGRG